MDDTAKELLVSVPAWGIFAFLVIKVVLDFIAKRDVALASKTASDGGLTKPPTPEEIAAVIRDQQERQEILESLRSQSTTQVRLAEALEHVASAQERIAATQDRQTQLIERQGQRTRALAETIATSRNTLDQLVSSVATLRRDTERIFAALATERPVRDDSNTIPVSIPIG
jgi:predicted ribosome quality control (RQC) complex YloA/Tae2 family protein